MTFNQAAIRCGTVLWSSWSSSTVACANTGRLGAYIVVNATHNPIVTLFALVAFATVTARARPEGW